jgi:lipopolysaccharide assembly outer membrane protein LptD (OstA)
VGKFKQVIGTLVSIFLIGSPSFASLGKGAVTQADKISQDSQKHQIILEGNAALRDGDGLLQADKISIDLQTGLVTASGHCVYEKDGKFRVKDDQMLFRVAEGKWEPQYNP